MIKITRDVNLDEKSIQIENDKLTVHVSNSPDNKLKKTENGLEVLSSSNSSLELGTETKSVEKVQVNGKDTTLVFTEVLNHNQQGKRMFVCTDIIQDSNSLIYTPSTNSVDTSTSSDSDSSAETFDYSKTIETIAYGEISDGHGNAYLMFRADYSIHAVPYTIKMKTTDFTSVSPDIHTEVEKTSYGFDIKVVSYPSYSPKIISLSLEEYDSSKSIILEFPDGKTWTNSH